jgi:hypothetical protein
MPRRNVSTFLTGLAMCVLAAPMLWPRDHAQIAAADPLAWGEAPTPTNVIHLAQLTFSDQDQAPAASDRAKSVQPLTNESAVRATKQSPTDHSHAKGPTSLSAETVMNCLEVARDVDPELGRELGRKHEKNPAEFEQALRSGQVGRGLWSLVQLRQRDPHLYKLKISEMTQSLQINRKAAELHLASQTTDTGRIESLKNQLRELLQLQLAMSLKARCEYIATIEEQLKKLQHEVENDAANFHAIIDGRLKQYMESPPQTDPTAVIPASTPASTKRTSEPAQPTP